MCDAPFELPTYRSCPPRPIFAHQGPFLLSKDHYFYVDHRMQRRFRVRRASRGLFFPTTVFLPTKVRFCPPRSVFAHQGPFLPTKVLSVFAVLLSCYIVLYCRFAVFAVFAVFAFPETALTFVGNNIFLQRSVFLDERLT